MQTARTGQLNTANPRGETLIATLMQEGRPLRDPHFHNVSFGQSLCAMAAEVRRLGPARCDAASGGQAACAQMAN